MNFLGAMIYGVGLLASCALAQPVESFAELEIILDDQILLEDFEGISLHGGSTVEVPNPLNSVTILQLPWGWDIHAGITYESPTSLAIHAGFLGGTEDVYLRSADGVEIRFDVGQVAFGLDLIGTSVGNAYTVEVYGRDGVLIEAFDVATDGGVSFVGYEAATLGISRVMVSHPVISSFSVNDVAFGAEFVPCPADMNGDFAQDIFDVFAFIEFFNAEDDAADFDDNGQFDIFDVFAFVGAFGVACP